jgi:hypothetical protein
MLSKIGYSFEEILKELERENIKYFLQNHSIVKLEKETREMLIKKIVEA